MKLNRHSKSSLDIMFGNDPEVMLLSNSTGQIVSSLDVLKNNKHNPIELGDGMKMYADNVLVEFAGPPASTVGAAVGNLREVFVRAQARLGSGYSLLPKASHVYDDLPPKPDDGLVLSWLNNLIPTESIHEAWQVGCNPNYNAYTGEQRKQSPFPDGMRTGSFHIHIGNANYQDDKEEKLMTAQSKMNAIKLMDIFVGCAGVIFDKDPTAPARRKLYGQAGEFRPTDYGCEYRVLGNYALRSPKLTELVFDLTAHAMSYIESGKAEGVFAAVDEALVRNAINLSSPALAKQVLLRVCIPPRLGRRIEEGIPELGFAEAWGLT